MTAADIAYRINVGGGAVSGAPAWSTDANAAPSSYSSSAASRVYADSASVAVTATVPAGTPSSLFQSCRWDPAGAAEMQWRFPVTPGQYEVRLYFAELTFSAVGQRAFDVSVEGAKVLSNFDVVAAAGGYRRGIMRSFVTNADSNLDIAFGHVVENPMVSAIEIIRVRPDLVVTDVAWSPASPAPSQPVTFSATVRNQGSAPTPSGIVLGVGFRVDGASTVSWSGGDTAALAPGATRTFTANGGPTGAATWAASAGSHSVQALVDDVDRLVEGDETNNTRTESLTVSGGTTPPDAAASSYDDVVLADSPVGYWPLGRATGTEPDLTGRGHDGTHVGGIAKVSTMPNGDAVAVFDGVSQYVTIASDASLSIPTTGSLTWEGWIRPDVLEFPHDSSGGYVDWMGKCANYSPTCEWEARMYSTTNPQGRCNRLSAYAFNPSAGLGSAADWQPTCGLFVAGQWHHVVGEYTTSKQPASCAKAATFPGSLEIWVDGIPWAQGSHGQTGCMSQYDVKPQAKTSPLNIGTMARDTWFAGAIGKVAIYDRLLSQARIAAHYSKMTGKVPMGQCGDKCTTP